MHVDDPTRLRHMREAATEAIGSKKGTFYFFCELPKTH